MVNGSAIAQAVSRRLLTAEARIRAQVRLCKICGGQRGTGTGFTPTSSVLPCQYHFIVAAYPLLYHLVDGQRSR
jgi:hypothetical protein